jgi:ankyrin repeat protein
MRDAPYIAQTPLHYAATVGSVPLVELLLQRGAQLAVKDWDGFTPVQLAIEDGTIGALPAMLHLLLLLLESIHRWRVPRLALSSVVWRDRLAVAFYRVRSLCLTCVCHAGVVSTMCAKNDVDNALHWAASAGNLEIGRLLLVRVPVIRPLY